MQAQEELSAVKQGLRKKGTPPAPSPKVGRFAKEGGQFLERIRLRLARSCSHRLMLGTELPLSARCSGSMTQFTLLPQAFAQASWVCIGHDSLSSQAFPGLLLDRQEERMIGR